MDFDSNEINEFKIEVFVPLSAKDEVAKAIMEVHAGVMGNYFNCMSFTKVSSFWCADENATPFLGEKGEECRAEEVKIETRCTKDKLDLLVSRIKEAHPYETVCINVIPLLKV